MSARSGARTFVLLWTGRMISMLGSELTAFALGIWVYQRTGSVTLFALMALFSVAPGAVLLPVLGAVADRWDRRRAMILADAVGALAVGALFLVMAGDKAEIWHLYLAGAINSVARGLHLPAYVGSLPLLLPKQELPRASAIAQLGPVVAQIGGRALGGLLVAWLGVPGVLLVDVLSFLADALVQLAVRLPRPASSVSAERPRTAREEVSFGLLYILARPGLRGLLLMSVAVDLALGLITVLLPPFLLRIASTAALGMVQSLAGLGMLIGGLLASAWRGFRRKVHGVVLFSALFGLSLALSGLRPSTVLIAIGSCATMFWVPLFNASAQAIWVAKVPPDIQGRVFAARWMIGWSSFPIAFAVAGPLAEGVFEPLVAAGGPLSATVGRLIGTGPGRGVALLAIVMGLVSALVALAGLFCPRLLRVEDELPDAIPDEPALPGLERAERACAQALTG
ncbi:MFS transporter [Sorangium sp. So ce124]|uniref:MFS transporter n=1 Tax=Sorangium sp. So ce124 TaxID=3133280 RepID=UPI003F6448E8